MILGVKQIVIRINKADEYSIYRRTDQKNLFLLFSFDTKEQAITVGKKLARLLNKSFINELDLKKRKTSGEAFSSSSFTRRKK
ncbi:MAG: hypothetical protein ACTSUP_08110 [Candidatus Heimdallarchaeaceae archaeon]